MVPCRSPALTCLTLDTVAEAEKCFAALSDGGTVLLPLQKTFFSSGFGMTRDKFGVNWMIMAMQA